VEFQKQKR